MEESPAAEVVLLSTHIETILPVCRFFTTNVPLLTSFHRRDLGGFPERVKFLEDLESAGREETVLRLISG